MMADARLPGKRTAGCKTRQCIRHRCTDKKKKNNKGQPSSEESRPTLVQLSALWRLLALRFKHLRMSAPSARAEVLRSDAIWVASAGVTSSTRPYCALPQSTNVLPRAVPDAVRGLARDLCTPSPRSANHPASRLCPRVGVGAILSSRSNNTTSPPVAHDCSHRLSVPARCALSGNPRRLFPARYRCAQVDRPASNAARIYAGITRTFLCLNGPMMQCPAPACQHRAQGVNES